MEQSSSQAEQSTPHAASHATSRSPSSDDDDYAPAGQQGEALRSHHQKTLWVVWGLIFLGGWMVLAPFTFGYEKAVVAPSGGRELWLELEARLLLMQGSDILSGLLLLVFGWRALTPGRGVSRWVCCFVGIWLSLAPILFWAPSAAAYLNSTGVGLLVMLLSVIVPGLPYQAPRGEPGPTIPAGWSYNPSGWPQRGVLLVLAVAGWMAARYLAVYQMGYVDHAWDPFFGEGTRQVLDSDLSHAFPVSDGAMGAFVYTIEGLLLLVGGVARWRTVPWAVASFGLFVIPLGLVHILLIMSQPVTVGAWCTLCLVTAGVSILLIPLAVGEVVAMGQYLHRASQQQDRSRWDVFWMGGPPEEGQELQERGPGLEVLPSRPRAVLQAGTWGVSMPWTLVLSTLAGVWLMFAPGTLGMGEASSANVHYLAGALVIVASVVSMGEPIRVARYLNIPIGVVLAGLPWVLGGELLAQGHALLMGLLVAGLALPAGSKKERYGEWDQYIR